VFHWQEPLTRDQVVEIVASKQVIYDAFKAASLTPTCAIVPGFSSTRRSVPPFSATPRHAYVTSCRPRRAVGPSFQILSENTRQPICHTAQNGLALLDTIYT
jgi:hypothetical protein